jgi:peptide/nickel transport system substrate-binding protein
MMRLISAAVAVAFLSYAALAADKAPQPAFKETPSLQGDVQKKALPAIAQRVPAEPLIVDLKAQGREPGKPGGVLRMLMSKEKDVRLLNTWGYARLIAWTPKLELKPDLLRSVEVKDGRVFTFKLRAGHKWSDGQPFTSEDFRYFWQDVATNKELNPGGPPVELLNGGEAAKVEIVDATTVRYSWSKPNARFLASLAQAREPYIYRPAHYLKQFHGKYAKAGELSKKVAAAKARSWAQLHNQMDAIDDNDNPAMPTLQPWVAMTAMPSNRFSFKRNPYFHRVDTSGQQLPYVDAIDVSIADGGLIAAKAAAGDADLQARGLSLSDVTVLKANEAKGKYKVLTWPIAKGAQVALYPNLNANDAGWRALMRDQRFRRALSLGINRSDINKALFFGMATEGNNAVLKASPLFKPEYLSTGAGYDPKGANALLDQIGLKARGADGVRLMADKRPLELIVETAGESKDESDVLQLIGQHYKALGIKLVIKPSDRTQMRNRAYSGEAMMTVWAGWDTGVPTADLSPAELAPTRQDTLIWPKWGNHFETSGKSGEAPDLPAAKELLKLDAAWNAAKSPAERKAAWDKMLAIHAEQQFIIGTVSGVMQPIVVSTKLRNVPQRGIFSWDPGAQFGMYRMDEFWLQP